MAGDLVRLSTPDTTTFDGPFGLRDGAALRPAYIVTADTGLQRSSGELLRRAGFLVRTYDSGADFLEEAPYLPKGCLVVDIDSQGTGGLQLIVSLSGTDYPFRVIVLARSLERLLPAAVAAIAGDDAAAAPDAAEDDTSGAGDAFASLTPRESDVMRGVIAGMTNKLIGRMLAISPRTVEVYRASVMSKTGATSVPDLVRRAIQAGLETAAPQAAVA